MEQYKLRFKPTGNVFVLPKEEALKILSDDVGNYEILNKDFVGETSPKTKETSVYNKIVEEDVKPVQKQKKQGKQSK